MCVYTRVYVYVIDDINILQCAVTRNASPLAQWRTTVGRFCRYSQIRVAKVTDASREATDEECGAFSQQLRRRCPLCYCFCSVCFLLLVLVYYSTEMA